MHAVLLLTGAERELDRPFCRRFCRAQRQRDSFLGGRSIVFLVTILYRMVSGREQIRLVFGT
jgi:hypothetical protein